MDNSLIEDWGLSSSNRDYHADTSHRRLAPLFWDGFPEPTLHERYELSRRYVKTWDKYVADVLLGSGIISSAGIYDHKGHVLAHSDDFYITKAELDHILQGFDQPDTAYNQGVTVAQQKYKVLLADGARGILCRNGVMGCTVCKTATLVIVGVHKDGEPLDKCSDVVMSLGDFLRDKAL